MGTIWVKEFTGGLDTRRLPVTTTAGVLIKANNGHINRGGEFEKRAAFASWQSATDTVGMAAGADGIYVFGHTVRPAALHADVKYQQLVHPTVPATALAKILSTDPYAGKLYVAAEFVGGDRFFYYDGAYVESWSDEFARATFTIKQVDVYQGEPGTGTFRIKPGALGGTEELTTLSVGSLDLISAPVVHPGTKEQHIAFLDAVVAAVNALSGTTGFSASRKQDSWVIKLTGPVGDAYNGDEIDAVVTGTMTVIDATKITGGVGAGNPTLSELWLGDTALIDSQVLWSTGSNKMAEDIATEINTLTGTSGFSATSEENKVIIKSVAAGTEFNGLDLAYTVSNDLEFEDVTASEGGSNDSLPRGTYLKTANNKVYAVSGKVLYFSGIAAPTKWTTDNVGAGFVDMGAQTSQGEALTAVSRYQSYLAIFAERTIIIEYIDPDPTLNRVIQVMRNTGTRYPNSVTEFGDADVFYADTSGLRSVQSRTNTTSASTADIGVPIDPLLAARLAEVLEDDVSQVYGLIEPKTGNFWLIVKDIIYVFALYPGAKVSAWTTYTPSYHSAGADVEFDIQYAAVYDRKVYLRSGDTIRVYGGTDINNPTYDEILAEAWLPYMDANTPTRAKEWQFVDVAIDGLWTCEHAMDPNDEDAVDGTITLSETTYGVGHIPLGGQANHLSLRLSTRDAKAAKLSSLVVSFEGHADENS